MKYNDYEMGIMSLIVMSNVTGYIFGKYDLFLFSMLILIITGCYLGYMNTKLKWSIGLVAIVVVVFTVGDELVTLFTTVQTQLAQ